jgi:hypothetical protein
MHPKPGFMRGTGMGGVKDGVGEFGVFVWGC